MPNVLRPDLLFLSGRKSDRRLPSQLESVSRRVQLCPPELQLLGFAIGERGL